MTPEELAREIEALQAVLRQWEEAHPGCAAALTIEVSAAITEEGGFTATWDRSVHGVELDDVYTGLWRSWRGTEEGSLEDFRRVLLDPEERRAQRVRDLEADIFKAKAELERLEQELEQEVSDVSDP